MECGINFRSPESQAEYFAAYENTMRLFCVEVQEEYVDTEFGKSHVIKAGNVSNPPLVLLGENEFAFDIKKAERRAKKCIQRLEIEIVKGASHLIPVSKPEYINDRILRFLDV